MVDYIEKIQYNGHEPQYIQSDCFRGEWVWKYLSLSSQTTYNPSDKIVYSLDDYLPKDNYDYEVLATVETNTGSTAGNAAYIWVVSGSGWSFRGRVCAVRTSTASNEKSAGSILLPIMSNDRAIALHLESGAHTTGSTWFRVYGYRRLGRNDWESTNAYEKMQFNNGSIPFGGEVLPGKWIVNSKTILNNYVIPALVDNVNGTVDADLTSFIPNDGYDYECLIDGTVWTDSTNGHYVVLRTYIWELKTQFQIAALTVRSGATKTNYFNFKLPIRHDKKVIRLINTGSSVANTNLRIQAYRRMSVHE